MNFETIDEKILSDLIGIKTMCYVSYTKNPSARFNNMKRHHDIEQLYLI